MNIKFNSDAIGLIQSYIEDFDDNELNVEIGEEEIMFFNGYELPEKEGFQLIGELVINNWIESIDNKHLIEIKKKRRNKCVNCGLNKIDKEYGMDLCTECYDNFSKF